MRHSQALIGPFLTWIEAAEAPAPACLVRKGGNVLIAKEASKITVFTHISCQSGSHQSFHHVVTAVEVAAPVGRCPVGEGENAPVVEELSKFLLGYETVVWGYLSMLLYGTDNVFKRVKYCQELRK